MQQKPKVSITIPCYNQEKTIRQAVASALAQDYPNLEIVISDNHSTDKSVEIIKSFKDKRIKLFTHTKNRGRIANYYGMLHKYTTGELFLNVDGDDYLEDPRYISKAVTRYQEEKDIVVVFAKFRTLIEATGKITNDKVNTGLPKIMDGDWFFLNYPKGYTFPYVTCLIHAQTARDVGFYRKDILSLDWESILKLILGHKVGYIDEYVAVYRRHQANNTHDVNMERIMENVVFIEEPYQFAMQQGRIAQKQLDRWRLAMLKRYFVKQLVRLQVTKRKDLFNVLMANISKEYPQVKKSIICDLRYWVFKAIHHNKPLMRIIFKHYFKLEGFYHDLENTKNIKPQDINPENKQERKP